MDKNTFTKKDFITYLAKGGNVKFQKPIKLNRKQLAKLDKDQRNGRSPIYIEGVKGYLDGKGYWEPATKSKNALEEQVVT